MENLKSFLRLADRIKKLTDEAAYDAPVVVARNAPKTAANAVNRLRIGVDSSWNGRMSIDDEDAAQRAFAIIREEKRVAGEIEKRRALREYSRELESLRAAIVCAAAAASIDIGVFSRNLAKEAGDTA